MWTRLPYSSVNPVTGSAWSIDDVDWGCMLTRSLVFWLVHWCGLVIIVGGRNLSYRMFYLVHWCGLVIIVGSRNLLYRMFCLVHWCGLVIIVGGRSLLYRMFCRLFGCLKATMGGSGKTLDSFEFFFRRISHAHEWCWSCFADRDGMWGHKGFFYISAFLCTEVSCSWRCIYIIL